MNNLICITTNTLILSLYFPLVNFFTKPVRYVYTKKYDPNGSFNWVKELIFRGNNIWNNQECREVNFGSLVWRRGAVEWWRSGGAARLSDARSVFCLTFRADLTPRCRHIFNFPWSETSFQRPPSSGKWSEDPSGDF